MKVAFLFGKWSIGNRPLNFFANNINISTRGLTGSELGIITTAQEFVKLGHDVSLFTVHVPGTKPAVWEGVNLYDIDEAATIITDDFDAIISWSEPDVLRGLPTKPVRVVCQMLNDWTYTIPGFDEYIDQYTAPCQMLIDHLSKQNNCPAISKFTTLPLGCVPELYTNEKIPGRCVWTSSADRGLHWVLQEWSKIKAAVPYASLKIFYNFSYGNLDETEPDTTHIIHHTVEMAQRIRYMKESIKRLKHLDVEHIGSISRDQMRQELNQAELLLYPCDPVAFSEGWSVSILESCAAGVLPIITNADCLGSIYGNTVPMIPTPVHKNIDQWTELVIKGLQDHNWRQSNANTCQKFAQNYTWAQSAKKLENIIMKHPKMSKYHVTNQLVTQLIKEQIYPKNNLIPLDAPFINNVGSIQNLITNGIESVAVITSKKGSVRSNHYHQHNSHYLYVISGSVNYYERDLKENGNEIAPILVQAGQMIFTPPHKVHKVEFLEDTVLVSLAPKSNAPDEHDQDTIKEEF